ncbi:hypothetical protein F7734_56245 [Scytonema sp. UIC 10036]|uniref:hypothetical protein n=1 Tax=Scytonema sp. UIC 10036 TaxID=2304196 RepID=UPI0012DAB73B|nr:hypothetical protein [Scytonema sp. UIC 10036]MUH01129.1 hypothetical protein [Scytonema sp. UIC 10036]
MIESNFYERIANKIVNSLELTEEEIHEAKRRYESFFDYPGFSSELEQLPYNQFKVFEYLELYGYVVRQKRPEVKNNFWIDNLPVILVVFCTLFAVFTLSIAFIGSSQQDKQENPSRIY